MRREISPLIRLSTPTASAVVGSENAICTRSARFGESARRISRLRRICSQPGSSAAVSAARSIRSSAAASSISRQRMPEKLAVQHCCAVEPAWSNRRPRDVAAQETLFVQDRIGLVRSLEQLNDDRSRISVQTDSSNTCRSGSAGRRDCGAGTGRLNTSLGLPLLHPSSGLAREIVGIGAAAVADDGRHVLPADALEEIGELHLLARLAARLRPASW